MAIDLNTEDGAQVETEDDLDYIILEPAAVGTGRLPHLRRVPKAKRRPLRRPRR